MVRHPLMLVLVSLGTAMTLTLSAGARADDGDTPAVQLPPVTNLQSATLALQLPTDNLVAYSGEENLDNAGLKSGNMLYGPGLVGFFAAAITHAALISGEKSRQKDAIQLEADKVLTPYRPILDGFTYRQLMQQGISFISLGSSKTVVDTDASPAGDWVVESVPTFTMTQDKKAIFIDNAIAIHHPGVDASQGYQYIVRVASQPRADANQGDFWSADQGERLKEQSARLFAESVNIALAQMAVPSNVEGQQTKTYRYLLGGAEKFERAWPIAETCNRALLKNLRGWLMSLPLHMSSTTACSASAIADLGATSVLTGAAVPASAAAAVPAPVVAVAREFHVATDRKGYLTVHYFRALRDYTGWGVHSWGPAFANDSQWFSPTPPSAYDDFGAVFYLLGGNDTTASEAHYIIHNGDTKDQCDRDMEWDTKKSGSIFVVQDDCNVYYDLASAKHSRQYRQTL